MRFLTLVVFGVLAISVFPWPACAQPAVAEDVTELKLEGLLVKDLKAPRFGRTGDACYLLSSGGAWHLNGAQGTRVLDPDGEMFRHKGVYAASVTGGLLCGGKDPAGSEDKKTWFLSGTKAVPVKDPSGAFLAWEEMTELDDGSSPYVLRGASLFKFEAGTLKPLPFEHSGKDARWQLWDDRPLLTFRGEPKHQFWTWVDDKPVRILTPEGANYERLAGDVNAIGPYLVDRTWAQKGGPNTPATRSQLLRLKGNKIECVDLPGAAPVRAMHCMRKVVIEAQKGNTLAYFVADKGKFVPLTGMPTEKYERISHLMDGGDFGVLSVDMGRGQENAYYRVGGAKAVKMVLPKIDGGGYSLIGGAGQWWFTTFNTPETYGVCGVNASGKAVVLVSIARTKLSRECELITASGCAYAVGYPEEKGSRTIGIWHVEGNPKRKK